MSGVAVVYTYSGPAEHSYAWTVTGGTIVGVAEGVGVVSVEVVWGDGVSGGAGTIAVTEDNGAGCVGTATGTAIVVLPNSVANPDGSAAVRVFPHPARDRFTVSTGRVEGVRVRVFDVRGAVVADEPAVFGQIVVDCSSWAAGVYSVEVGGGVAVPVTVVR
jgi:hypothetical protein